MTYFFFLHQLLKFNLRKSLSLPQKPRSIVQKEQYFLAAEDFLKAPKRRR